MGLDQHLLVIVDPVGVLVADELLDGVGAVRLTEIQDVVDASRVPPGESSPRIAVVVIGFLPTWLRN
ncbi:MAG: hypothetical protein M5T61_09810 [Acidimicrobiia bacterium]|nr:hypothetical protein [Acidimicrobiia bacterium]